MIYPVAYRTTPNSAPMYYQNDEIFIILNGGHIMQGVIVFVRHHSQWLKSGKVSKRDAFVWDLYMGSMNKNYTELE